MKKIFTLAAVALLAVACLLCSSCSGEKSTGITSSHTSATQTSTHATTAESSKTVQSTAQASTAESTKAPQKDFSHINKFREDYNVGTCKDLSGKVAVVLFFMDDFESKWTNTEIESFTKKEIEPGLEFLEKEAAKYGVSLELSIEKTYKSVYYSGEVIESVRNTGLATIDVLVQAANAAGFSNTVSMLNRFRILYKTDEVVCLTIFNKDGTAYAINPKKDETMKIDEHCIIFTRDLGSAETEHKGFQASVIAHEMLHLFGAEDFYAAAARKKLARAYYPNDIMLSTSFNIRGNNIGEATAFYIGWADNVPPPLLDPDWN